MVRPRKNPIPDGRVNSGGSRTGTPGQAYPQRSDMRTQAVTTVPGQEYGKAAAQARAQRAVPMAAAPPVPPPASGTSNTGGAPLFATPQDTPNLLDPTQRPDEPLEHGMPFGPGAGPEILGGPPISDTMAQIRALYLAHPTPELRDLIAQAEQGG